MPAKARGNRTRKSDPKPAKQPRKGDRHSPDTIPVHTRQPVALVTAVEEKLATRGHTKTALVRYVFDEYNAGRLTLPEPRPEDMPAPSGEEAAVPQPAAVEPAPAKKEKEPEPDDGKTGCPYDDCGHRAATLPDLMEHVTLAHEG